VKIVKQCGRLMASATIYGLWQAPFAHAKMMPVFRHNDIGAVQRVLDVGCGPGTNCRYFAKADYLGLDVNPRYVAYARRRYRREFSVQDVCAYRPSDGRRFDFILLNSLLHHLTDDETRRLLGQLSQLTSSGGFVHIIELVLPERKCLARWLATHDRGDYARPVERWQELFAEHFQAVVFEPFAIQVLGVNLWSLVYFKGRPENCSRS
jgi:SAM-dependent methyltransferase